MTQENNHNLKYFAQNQLSILASFMVSSLAIIYQLSASQASSTLIIVVYKKNPYYCYSLYLKYSYKSFLHKAIVHKPVFVLLSYKG